MNPDVGFANVLDRCLAVREEEQVLLLTDAGTDAAKNAELAKNRARAVRHALEANGVALDRLVLDKPMVASGGADAREARRVEMRLR